jgi:hypothetical protein
MIEHQYKPYEYELPDSAFVVTPKLAEKLKGLIKKSAAEEHHKPQDVVKQESDGSTAGYYELPEGAKELQDLISHRNMNAQIGEVFRACYRYGLVKHSPEIRDIKKIIYYAQAELKRLEKLKCQ